MPAASKPPSRSGGRPLRALVLAGLAVVLTTIGGGALLLIDRTERTARANAVETLERSAQALENALNRQLLQVDGALASLPALLSATRAGAGEVTAESAQELLRGLNFQTFAFRNIFLLSPGGAPWASSRPSPSRWALPVDLSELRDRASGGSAAVAGPARDRISGDWSLYLARPVAVPGAGEFTAVAEVSIPTLVKLLSEAGIGAATRVTIERRDGQVLATVPHDELAIGKRSAVTAEEKRQDGRAFELHPASGRERLAVVRPSLYGDILVAVETETSAALAGWLRDRNRAVVAVALAALLVLALAFALLVALRQREKLETERARLSAVLEDAIEAMADGFVMWDAEDRLVTCNRRYRELYSVSAPFLKAGERFEDIIRQGVAAGQYPQVAHDPEAFIAATVAWHREGSGTLERLLPDGRWLLITERRMAHGGIVGIRTEITALKTALAELAEANHRATLAVAETRQQNAALSERDRALHHQNALFEVALDNMAQGLLMVDRAGRLIVANRRFAEIFGLARGAAASGRPVAELLDDIGRAEACSGAPGRELRAEHDAVTASGRFGSFVATTPGGRAVAVSQRPLDDGGWVATYEDVTEKREAENRIRYLAHHDELTGLPNRVLFQARMAEALQRAAARQEEVALLYLDLDKFKDVNDTLGHSTGDALLKSVARRLDECLDRADLVARLGGDEFAVIYPDTAERRAVEALSARIIAALSRPYEIQGRNVAIGVSVGIAFATEAGRDADALLRHADLALYQAKEKGRGTFCVFESGLALRLRARLETEADLRKAVERGELELAYQPIFDLASNRACGFEALLRWRHPERGFVSPGEFVPIAEEMGLIDRIGAFVLRRACLDVAALPSGIRVAVNLSACQLRSGEIARTVADAIRETGLDPARLELEITETALLENNNRTVGLLNALRSLGLRIVLDDFGTGYSSLSHLRNFPLSKIKIDRSFIRDMATRADSLAIVTSVVGLAQKLGMTTTAEGIETAEQLSLVRQAGCSEAQGYLLGRPRSILHAPAALGAAPPDVAPAPLRAVSRFSRKPS